MRFSRQEDWSGLPFPPPGDLSNLGIEPASPAAPALQGGFITSTPPGKPASTNGAGNTGYCIHTQISEIGPLTYTIHKNELKLV